MHSLTDIYRRFGATLREVGDLTVPASFPRPTRARIAVRAGVGLTHHPWGLMTVGGADRRSFLADTLTCALPAANAGTYGFLLSPEGDVRADLYLLDVGEQFLCVTAPGRAGAVAEHLGERTFIQDVEVADVTDDHAVMGLHGPAAATKLAGVVRGGTVPDDRMEVSRVVVRDHGVTLLRLDAPVGESGFAAVCRAEEAAGVFDALATLGAAATPFGYDTWSALTLEAGTPLYATELAGRQPNVCGQLAAGVDLEKGCFVGQEVVARVANLGRVQHRLVGLRTDATPAAGAAVETDDGGEGHLTRVAPAPDGPGAIAMALLPRDVGESVTLDDDGHASIAPLPFVEGSERSGRLPVYGD